MSKSSKSQAGFSILEALLVVVLIALLCAIGYLVYKNRAQIASRITQPSKSQANPHTTWETGIFRGDSYTLLLRYPQGWTASTDPVTTDLLLKKAVSQGTLTVRLGYAADGEIANSAGNYGYGTVSTFTFNGQPAYIVSDSYGGAYLLSSCQAPSLCFFAPKNPSKYKGISAYITYYVAGDQQERKLPNDPAALNEATQILATLAYQ